MRGLASLQITPVTDVSGSVQGVLVLCNKLGDEFMYSDQSAASFLAAFISAVLLRLHHRPTQALTAKQDGGSVSRFYSSDVSDRIDSSFISFYAIFSL